MAQQTTSGVRGIPRPVQSFSPKTEVEVVIVKGKVRIGAHGILGSRGKIRS